MPWEIVCIRTRGNPTGFPDEAFERSGLELVPDCQPIAMLAVEKVK
jgi:hypothetical protein